MCRPVSLEQSIDQVPPLLLRPVSQGARPAPRPRLNGPQFDLTPPSQRMADQTPVSYVFGCVYRAAWVVFERGGTKEIAGRSCRRCRHHAYCRVRIEAPQYGVFNDGFPMIFKGSSFHSEFFFFFGLAKFRNLHGKGYR